MRELGLWREWRSIPGRAVRLNSRKVDLESDKSLLRIDEFLGVWDARGVPVFANDIVSIPGPRFYLVETRTQGWALDEQKLRANQYELPMCMSPMEEILVDRWIGLQVVGYLRSTNDSFDFPHCPEPRLWYRDFMGAGACLKRPMIAERNLLFRYPPLAIEKE